MLVAGKRGGGGGKGSHSAGLQRSAGTQCRPEEGEEKPGAQTGVVHTLPGNSCCVAKQGRETPAGGSI